MLTLTGGFELVRAGDVVPVPHSAQRLLAYLALTRVPVDRSRLASRLWGDVTEQRAASNLRTALWRLHGAWAKAVTVRDRRLALGPGVTVDVVELTALAHRFIRGPDDDSLDRLPDMVAGAELLPDWDDEWVVADRERLRLLRLEALESAAAALLDRGRLADAMLAARSAVEAEPLRESTRRLVVRVHLARGNIAEALCCYRAYSELLREEFGVRPSPAMTGLVQPWLLAR